jgi:hypothetical protein
MSCFSIENVPGWLDTKPWSNSGMEALAGIFSGKAWLKKTG